MRITSGSTLLALLCFLSTAAACGGSPARPPEKSQEPAVPLDAEVAATVERVLASAEHPGLTWRAISDVAPALKPLYEAEPDRLFWLEGERPHPALEGALSTLAAAGEQGLEPADYDAARLAGDWAAIKAGSASASDRALFDVGLSVAAARLLSAGHRGRVDPTTMDWGYDVARKQLDLAATLRDARSAKGLAAALAELEPPFSHYARARRTLAAYRAIVRAGEPEPVPSLAKGQRKLEPGKPWAGVPRLAARLRAFGDLPAGAADAGGASDGTPLYSRPLVEAVESFQRRHGLEADGVIGAGTLEALNVSAARRARQLELAMERMRWLPKLGERPTVFVNVPLFRLWATDPKSGAEPLRMNVVVGKSVDHKTPIFIGEMRYVIFRPYWNPPYGIVKNEIVPKARKDATYFDREDLEIVASGDEDAAALPPTPANLDRVVAGKLHVRQKPGPNNSLGLAKFIFPNTADVYMHGTPAQQLFSRARRDFSHGCIRLEDPAGLAEWVLRDQPGWSRARIEAAMQGARPTRANLKQPLSVVLFYDTVHVNSEGVVHFVGDIYGHDRDLDAALLRGYPYPTKG
jgi:murein L,D-transpeptidase YcbB/YkuD